MKAKRKKLIKKPRFPMRFPTRTCNNTSRNSYDLRALKVSAKHPITTKVVRTRDRSVINNHMRKWRNLHQIQRAWFRVTEWRTTERWGGCWGRMERGLAAKVAAERLWRRMRERRGWKRFWREALNWRASCSASGT